MTVTSNVGSRDGVGAIDLVSIPLSLPGSRLVVRRRDASIEIAEARYETDLVDTTFVRSLLCTDSADAPLAVSAVRSGRIEFGGGRASLAFAESAAVSVGGEAGIAVQIADGFGAVEIFALGDSSVQLGPGRPARSTTAEQHRRAVEYSADQSATWMAKCPSVKAELSEMAQLCWYVLGANSIDLAPGGMGRRAVVPSLLGYVGLWQWDAYFIATGLRHGDLELARIQIDLALGQAGPDGQLPDVVHDHGVLRTSADLPPSDLVTLQRHCPAALHDGRPVALTKPPLTAWAIAKIIAAADAVPDDGRSTVPPEWRSKMFDVAAASQDWWYRCSDADGDGMPEYAHPYSSGLDDSPIFDDGVPVLSADLASYLVVQDNILADHRSSSSEAAAHRRRRDETMGRLLELWDTGRARFDSIVNHHPRRTDAITGLMPLLTGALPEGIATVLVAALGDPARFGSKWPIPTVSVSDSDFSPTQMWRGPTWINTNYLVIEGLIASGYPAEARRLAEATVELIRHAGGPHEYFDPQTGRRPATATTAFSWSAALFIDLAVRLSAGEFEEELR